MSDGYLSDAELFGANGPVLETGQQPTPGQAAYATGNAQFRDPNAAKGTATNPTYDTADRTGAPGTYHVTQSGQLSAPPAAPDSGYLTDVQLFPHGIPLANGTPSQVSLLPQTPAMGAALAADAARGPSATDPGSLNVINGFTFGRAPEFDAAGSYLDAAASNALKRLTGQAVTYGASDAYAATKAADQDRLAQFQADHPWQGVITSGAGSALNPINMMAAGLMGKALSGAGATAKLMGLGGASLGSGALGAAEGALYGSADPNDPAGSAQRGAFYGGLGGLAAVPIGAGVGAATRGAVGAVKTLAAGPLATLGDAVRDLTPEQIAAAQGLRTDMAARGVDVTLPEAVQQVTNNGTALGRIQRVLEGTKRGEQILAPYFANRTGQVQGAVQDVANRIADPTQLPSAIGPRAQQAAQGGIDEVRGFINEAARPHYDAMAGNVVPATGTAAGTRYVPGPGTIIPQDAYQALAGNQAYQEALQRVRGDKLLNAGISKLPDNDVSVVNEVVKQLDALAEGSRQTEMNPSGNNYKASLYQNARNAADELATTHSPQWRAARDTVAAGNQWLMDPLKAGPVGTIATTESVPAQIGALYPAKPLAGAPAETETAMRVLNNQFPGVGADLTRQHVLTSLDSARPELANGPNPYLGPAFAVKVAGSPEREATLLSGINNIGPHGPSLAQDMSQLLEGLRATGKRQPAGSKTAFNESDLADWHVPKAARFLESFSLAEPLEPIAQILKALNYRRNVNGLADMITSAPDQTADILTRAQGAAAPPVALGSPQLPYHITSGLPAVMAIRNPPPSR